MVYAEYILHIVWVAYGWCQVQETLHTSSCFSHASGTGQKKGWPEHVHCGSAIMFLVKRFFHRAHWCFACCLRDLMNWLFNVKDCSMWGIRFSTSASRMSKAGWWDIIANVALLSEPCWHDAGLGFHDEVCHRRPVQWHALQQQVWFLLSKQERWWRASSELGWCQCFLRGQACWGRRCFFFIFPVFGSAQVFQKCKHF